MRVKIALALYMCLTVPSKAACEVYIKMLPFSTVASTRLELRQIADIRVANSSYSAVDIGSLRLDGIVKKSEERIVHRNDLEQLVKAAFVDDEIRFSGAERVIIRVYREIVSPEDIKEIAKDFLKKKYSNNLISLELEPLESIAAVKLFKKGNPELVARSSARNISRRICVFVDLFQDGELIKTIPVWFKVFGYKKVYRVVVDTSAGKEITKAHVEEVSVDIAAGNKTYLSEKGVIGMIAAKQLYVGDLLQEGHTKEKTDVIAGENVIVIAREGLVEVRVKATAMSDGNVGGLVGVESHSSKELYEGRVVGKNRVYVGR